MGVITRGIAQNILSNGRLDATDGLLGLIPNTNLNPIYFVDDSSTVLSIQTNERLNIAGGTDITTSISGDTLTINFNGTIPQSGTDFDPVGTDNSTDVTLVTTSYDYLSLSGQEITLNQIDATTDISNLGSINVSTFINDAGYITSADTFSLSISDDASNINVVDPGDTIRILGGTNISTELSGDTLTITNDFVQDFRYTSLTGAPTDLSNFNNDLGFVTAGDIGVYALNVADDSSTEIIITNTETLTIRGGTNISTSIGGGNTIDINFTGTIPQSGTDFDPVGTDNSTNVTLVTTSYDYLSLSGQEITLNQIDATTDISNLSSLNVSTFINDAGYITSADTFSLTIADDSSNINVVDPGDTIKIAGGTNISTELSGDTLTITNDFVQDFAYSSLTGAPTNVSTFINDAGYITSADTFSLSIADDSSNVNVVDPGDTIRILGGVNISTELSGDTLTITNDFVQDFAYSSLTGAPTNVSTFNNDAGYITDADVDIYSFFVADDSSTTSEINRLETLNIAGGTNISTSISGDTLTITNDFVQDFAYSSLTGAPTNVSSFNNDAGYITNADIFTINFVDDSSTVLSPDSGSSIKIAGGTNISTSISGDTITITNDFVQDFAYSSLTGAPTNVSTFNNDAGYITDADVDIYSFFVSDDSSTTTEINRLETLKVAGATGITTSISGDTLTITGTAQDFRYSSLTGAPTNVSSFTNDVGYITDADVDIYSFFISDDSSTISEINRLETLKIIGGTNISTSIIGDTITITNDFVQDFAYSSLTGAPTNVSTFNNDAGYLTSADLPNEVNIFLNVADDTSTTTTLSNNETLKIVGSTGVSTSISGDTLTITGTAQDFRYSSLTGAPTNVSSFTNDAGYITSADTFSFDISDDASNVLDVNPNTTIKIAGGTNISTEISGDTLTITNDFVQDFAYSSLTGAPTNISSFNNDAGYVTAGDIGTYALNVADDSSTEIIITNTETLTIRGGTDISTSIGGGNTIDINFTGTIPQSGADFDPVGTDNSTDVTLVTTNYDYLSLSGQQITLNQIDATTDISNLSSLNVSTFINDAGYITSADTFSISLSDDASNVNIIDSGDTIKIAGGTDIATSLSGDTLTIDFDGTIPQSGTDFDPVGTDNSTNVTLVTTSYDYLSLSGQEITLNQIDATTDISNLGSLNVSTFINDAGYITSADVFSISFVDDSSTVLSPDSGSSIKIAGGTNISTDISGDTITITNDFVQDFAYSSLTGAPTNVSSFNNDAGYITSADVFTISFADDTSTVVTPDSGSTIRIIGGTNISTAFSGDTLTITNDFTQDFAYSSLTGAPTNVSQFNNDAGYITNADIFTLFVGDDASTVREIGTGETIRFIGGTNISTTVDTEGNITITNDFTQDFAYSSLTGAPTNVSQFNNDAGYITSADVFSISFVDDSSTVLTPNSGESIKIAGGTGISTSISGDTITTSIDNTVVTLTGTQTLENKTLRAPTFESGSNSPEFLEQRYVNATQMDFVQLYTGQSSGSYFTQGEYQKVATIIPSGNGQNYTFRLRMTATSASNYQIVEFTGALRSTSLPNLTFTSNYYEEHNGTRFIEPKLWAKETTPAGFILAFEYIHGDNLYGGVNVEATIIPRYEDNRDNVTFNTTQNSEQSSIDTGYTENDPTLIYANVNGTLEFGTQFRIEGNTADGNELTITAADPTADRTITFPDATGTVALTGDIPQSGTDFDPAGTDNSTNVTLVTTSYDYLSLSGQEITLNQIDATTDISNLSSINVSTFINDAGYITSADTFSISLSDDSSNVNIVDSGDTIKIVGSTNITTELSGDTLTITGPDLSSYVTASSTTTFTNKSFDADGTGNSITNIDLANLKADILDTDLASVSGADDTIATAKAIKAYVDAEDANIASDTLTFTNKSGNISQWTNDVGYVTAGSFMFNIVDDSSTSSGIDVGETLQILGGTNITTQISGDTLTIDFDGTIPTNNNQLTNGAGYITNSSFNIIDDSSTTATIDTDDTLHILGGDGIATVITGSNSIEISADVIDGGTY